MIKAVLFDVGGVLHESNAVMDEDLKQELRISDTTLQDIWSDQILKLSTGEIDESTFWTQLARQHGIRRVENSENLLGRAFKEAIFVHQEILDLADELRNKGIQTAILSNTIPPHSAALRESGDYDGFDPVLLSHEIGIAKPGHEAYTYALDSMNLQPGEVIFIDDRLENIVTANEVGLRGIHFKNQSQVVHDVRSLIL